jgi:hypothetical protein
MLHTSPRREESRVDQEEKDTQQEQSGGLWAAGIFFVALVFLLIVLGGYVQKWEWTGLSTPKDRTFWDWLDLLIVPSVLAIGGYLFTRSENQRTLEDADRQRALDREISDERRQDDMLQAYLDGMSRLLTDKEQPLHSAKWGDSPSTVARARTLTVLGRLDRERKRSVVQFLFESGLIYKERTLLDESNLIKRQHNIVSLTHADLSGANLSGAVLFDVDLFRANLFRAKLQGATLFRDNLREANLSEADLSGADLSEANLNEAQLFDAKLGLANLSGAVLYKAYLSKAYLLGADLSGANLWGLTCSGPTCSGPT